MPKDAQTITFDQFINELKYWLMEKHGLDLKLRETHSDYDKDFDILNDDENDDGDEDERDFYIGSYADPGVRIKWCGPWPKPPRPTFAPVTGDHWLVECNGVLMSALGKHVAGWIVGFE